MHRPEIASRLSLQCMMPVLTKESILHNLQTRFKAELMYTYVGDIVVSVNPFKNTGCVGQV